MRDWRELKWNTIDCSWGVSDRGRKRFNQKLYIVKINDVKLYAHNEFERETDCKARKWFQMSAVSWLISVRWALLLVVVLFTFHDAYLLFEFLLLKVDVYLWTLRWICVCKPGFWDEYTWTLNSNHNRVKWSLRLIAKSHFYFVHVFDLVCVCVCSCIFSVFICFIGLFNSFFFPFYRSLVLLLCMFNLCCAMSFFQFRYLLKSLFTFPPPFTLASITQCKHSISILINHSGESDRERKRERRTFQSGRASQRMWCHAHSHAHCIPFILRHSRNSTNLSQSIWTLTLHVCIPLPATK